MMDVSDGLATDLRRMMKASGTGAVIDAARIPIASAARKLHDQKSPLEHALTDGEDFELLFTVPCRKVAAFEAAWKNHFRLRCTRIGTMTKKAKLIEIETNGVRAVLKAHGYEHFVNL